MQARLQTQYPRRCSLTVAARLAAAGLLPLTYEAALVATTARTSHMTGAPKAAAVADSVACDEK